jgi:spore germination protein
VTTEPFRRLTYVVAATALVAAFPSTAEARPTAAATTKVEVTAFQEDGDSNSLITRSAKAITTVGVDGVSIDSSGAGVAAPDAGALRALQVAHHDGLRAEFLVSNWDDSIEDFSPAIAQALLSSPTNVSAVAVSLAGDVQTQGWDGVSLDLESLSASDASGLVSLLQALRSDLPAGRTISINISNNTTTAGYREGGYDLAGIAASADRIILMAYDEHGPWEHKPGPVGALAWQLKGLKVMRQQVPADQIDLGQAGYGYAWRPHGTHTISDARARALVASSHATARFDSKVGEWTAHLSDGSTLWWADSRSFALRVAIARKQHLHGVAVWDLALSDPLRL